MELKEGSRQEMLRLTEKGFVSESDLGLILWGAVYTQCAMF